MHSPKCVFAFLRVASLSMGIFRRNEKWDKMAHLLEYLSVSETWLRGAG